MAAPKPKANEWEGKTGVELKVVFLGGPNIGAKTSLIERLFYGGFSETFTTIGSTYVVKHIVIDKIDYRLGMWGS